MSHIDPEQIALIAMGEPIESDQDRAHLANCATCAAELAEMEHAVVVGRSSVAEEVLDVPDDRVWARIHEELSLGTEVLDQAALAAEDVGETAVASDADLREVAQPAPRRRSTRLLWTLAASTALVVGGGVAVWAGISSSLTPVSIAAAGLDSFPAHPGALGSADIAEDREGDRTLNVTLEGASDSDDYREVWLIRNDGQALISLGVLEGATGSFSIPRGVDLSEYDLVDISFEPVDGDPAHSGDSIVRGQLDFL